MTVEKLLEMGFSAEEAEWAVKQASDNAQVRPATPSIKWTIILLPTANDAILSNLVIQTIRRLTGH